MSEVNVLPSSSPSRGSTAQGTRKTISLPDECRECTPMLKKQAPLEIVKHTQVRRLT
uniref:Uncharacterized protein n=1 Tax=Anguilla anguilla TaxID=7936 RepID=A0A0E9WHN7_ANGAN